MKEIKELLDQIDDQTLQNVSENKKRLIKFLKEVYCNKIGDGNPHA